MNEQELKLHAALLGYWEKLKTEGTPYINDRGDSIISVDEPESDFTVEDNGEKYTRFTPLDAALDNLNTSMTMEALSEPSEQSLHALFKFYRDSSYSMMFDKPGTLPIYYTDIPRLNIPRLYAYQMDLKEFISLLDTRDKADRGNRVDTLCSDDFIFLHILVDATKELQKDISQINLDLLSNMIDKKVVKELKDLASLKFSSEYTMQEVGEWIGGFAPTIRTVMNSAMPWLLGPILRMTVPVLASAMRAWVDPEMEQKEVERSVSLLIASTLCVAHYHRHWDVASPVAAAYHVSLDMLANTSLNPDITSSDTFALFVASCVFKKIDEKLMDSNAAINRSEVDWTRRPSRN